MIGAVIVHNMPAGGCVRRAARHMARNAARGALCVLPYRSNGSAATILFTVSIQN